MQSILQRDKLDLHHVQRGQDAQYIKCFERKIHDPTPNSSNGEQGSRMEDDSLDERDKIKAMTEALSEEEVFSGWGQSETLGGGFRVPVPRWRI